MRGPVPSASAVALGGVTLGLNCRQCISKEPNAVASLRKALVHFAAVILAAKGSDYSGQVVLTLNLHNGAVTKTTVVIPETVALSKEEYAQL